MFEEKKTCECGAVYEVDYDKVPFRDQDSYDCDVCGKELDRWSSSRIPKFRLITKPPKK